MHDSVLYMFQLLEKTHIQSWTFHLDLTDLTLGKHKYLQTCSIVLLREQKFISYPSGQIKIPVFKLWKKKIVAIIMYG